MLNVTILDRVYNENDMEIHMPTSIQGMSKDFGEFIARMLVKLDKNSHKSTPTKSDFVDMMGLLVKEVQEFEEQIKEDRTHENAGLELADIANFAFLAFVALRADNPNMKNLTEDSDDLPKYIQRYVPPNIDHMYPVSDNVKIPAVRYMYRRPYHSGTVLSFGPYLSVKAAVEYGPRAFMLKAERDRDFGHITPDVYEELKTAVEQEANRDV